MVATAVLHVLQNIFFNVKILNTPHTFINYCVLVLIVISIFLTRKRFLFLGQSQNDKMRTRIMLIGINTFKYFIAFAIIYYISFVVMFKMYVKYNGSLGPTEFYSIPISHINKASIKASPAICFYFEGKYNLISGNEFYELLNKTEDRFNPKWYINIECRKAILNSYLLDSYYIE